MNCPFCEEPITAITHYRHVIDYCLHAPKLTSGSAYCTGCKSVKPAADFPDQPGKHQCKACNLARRNTWLLDHRDEFNAKRRVGADSGTIVKRSGAWVLRECPYCKQSFKSGDFRHHAPRCPQKPDNGRTIREDVADTAIPVTGATSLPRIIERPRLQWGGREKVISKCKYCGEEFGAAELQTHRPTCPKRSDPWVRSFHEITCRWCNVRMSSKSFQPHLRDNCPTAPRTSANEHICTVCQEVKPLLQFYKTFASNHSCKACIMERSKTRYARPEVKERQKYLAAQSLYGITPDEYKALEAAQCGKCAMCREAPSGTNPKTSGLHVDHDHATGKVRGLLCMGCNHLVGNAQDSIPLLLAAIDYLRQHTAIPFVVA